MGAEEKIVKSNGITEGVIWKQILAFFFPILFGTFFQMLYNTVDAVIVGQFLGKQALAAVGGGTGTMINLIIGFFTGLSSGATVIISQFYGAKDDKKLRKSIHTALALALVGGAAISIFGFIFTEPLLKLISTPDDIMPLASTYLKIYFAGALSIVIYNIASGIFRALGDSKHPLYFLIIGSIANIILDILLIAIIPMGVAGAAIATVSSQILSAVLSLIWLRKGKEEATKVSLRMIAFDGPIMRRVMTIGLPAGIQSIMYNISNMIIQAKVNGFGTDAAAAWAAYGKLDAIFWMIINAFGIAITTFVGQNYGAGRIDRARKGVKSVFKMCGLTCVLLQVLYLSFGKYAYMIFLQEAEVIEIGMRMLNTIIPAFILYISIEIFSGTIRGAGKSVVPTLFTVVGICGLRLLWLSMPQFTNTIEKVLYCYPISWALVSLLFFIYYNKGDIYNEKAILSKKA